MSGDPPEPWPPPSAVLWLRACAFGIFGALAGAGFAVWLTLSHRIRGAATGIVGVDIPLVGACLGATFYLLWATRGWWRTWGDRDGEPPADGQD